MKTKFDNRMCAHVWAQQRQTHGHSASMRFEGRTLYSYQTPIARLVDSRQSSAPVALLTSNTYSVTTSGKHMPAAGAAVSHLSTFTVPHLDDNATAHAGNLAYLVAEYGKARDSLMRANPAGRALENFRTGAAAVFPTAAHAKLAALYNEAARYARYFELPDPALPWQADADAAIARRDRLMADPKCQARAAARAAEREKYEAELKAARFQRDADDRELWRGGRVYMRSLSDEQGGALIRLSEDGTVFQTSHGAEVPYDAGVRMLRAWAAAYARGVTQDFEPGQVDVGSFQLRSIAADGTMTIGCHTFHAPELLRAVAQWVGEGK